MFLDEILAAQKRGVARGIPAVCSSHPYVIKQALRVSRMYGMPPLIEATCNQVNQFGGYTGMRPMDFASHVRSLAGELGLPFEHIILGGDHLGPSVWQEEPAGPAMEKAEGLVREFVKAGFTKVHLDCSMRLADDPPGALDVDVSAARTARLAKAAEEAAGTVYLAREIRYIIGTEVPVPGGATAHEERVHVTKAGEAEQSIERTRDAFLGEGLEQAWEKVVGLVVQPGVEFGDDFILPYRPEEARELSRFIDSRPLIYEAHSTDYQARNALQEMVRDHFAILKVGPALTFAFREAVFALAMIENELFQPERRSNLMQVVDEAMRKQPGYWVKYYPGTEHEQAYKRKYSLSDRIRYYWGQPVVARAFSTLMSNLGERTLPFALSRQFTGMEDLNADQVIQRKIDGVLIQYFETV